MEPQVSKVLRAAIIIKDHADNVDNRLMMLGYLILMLSRVLLLSIVAIIFTSPVWLAGALYIGACRGLARMLVWCSTIVSSPPS